MKNKIFIDCGAHCGESILEAKKRFGNETKIYSFEANTNLANALIDHFKDDNNVKIENKAVWIEDSFIEFYLSTSWSDGSSLYSEKISGGVSKNISLKVPCIDLDSFINSFDKDDYIILKLDVEGAEYEILNKLIDTGTLGRVNEIHGEFHPDRIDKPEIKILEKKIYSHFNTNKIPFYSWELVGNSPKAIDRSIWKDKYEMQKITFVLPSRNNLEFLQLAYKSIRNLKTKHEILVLDDASTDGTQEWIKQLDDNDLITYHNPGPERIGIVGMFDKGIEMARTEIIFAFHADMIAGPNLDVNILKHLKPGTVVSATRIEPPLHPPGPEKITMPWGNEVEEVNFDSMISDIEFLEQQHKDKITEGIFAPWCMYKEDYLAVGGHDELFAPQSKEDSDLFNRFVLKGYKVIQSWDGLVYHFTSRGSRFNKHAGGGAGKNSEEWLHTTSKNARNFIRKWGHFVKHDPFMKPIIPPKYNIAFIVNNCNLNALATLEPWCDTIYIDDEMGVLEAAYYENEQPHTKIDLKSKIKVTKYNTPKEDITVEFDAQLFNQDAFNIINQLPEIIAESGEVGEFELDIFKIKINAMNTYEQNLVHIYNK
jgi:FkbM family methyltransferase